MISSDAISLYHQAQQAAEFSEQMDMLEAIVNESDRDLNKVLWGELDHGDLMSGDFAAAILALAASVGTKHIWRELQEFGYTLESPLYIGMRSNDISSMEQAWGEWTVAGWACSELEWDRVETLIRWELLHPWKQDGHARISDIKAGTMGMAYGDSDVFEALAISYQKRMTRFAEKNQFVYLDPSYDLMIGMLESAKNKYKNQSTAVSDVYQEELQRRVDVLSQEIVNVFYDHSTPEALWNGFIKKSLKGNVGATAELSTFVLSQCQGVDRWGNNQAATLLDGHDNLRLWMALVKDMPFDVLWARKDDLWTHLKKTSNDHLRMDAWDALVKRVKSDAPDLYRAIPREYKAGRDLVAVLRDHKQRASCDTWVAVWEQSARAPKASKKKM